VNFFAEPGYSPSPLRENFQRVNHFARIQAPTQYIDPGQKTTRRANHLIPRRALNVSFNADRWEVFLQRRNQSARVWVAVYAEHGPPRCEAVPEAEDVEGTHSGFGLGRTSKLSPRLAQYLWTKISSAIKNQTVGAL
jgi:hypothetical protein